MIRTILSIASAVLLIAGSGALVGFSVKRESNARYTGLEVDVIEIDGMFFVDAAGVRDRIFANDSISGTFVADLSLRRGALGAWHTRHRWGGNIPGLEPQAARASHPTQAAGSGAHFEDEPDFYIDDEGELLPLSPYYTARVPVIHAPSFEAAFSAFALVQATANDPLWSAFIDQIEVNGVGALDVVPQDWSGTHCFWRRPAT